MNWVLHGLSIYPQQQQTIPKQLQGSSLYAYQVASFMATRVNFRRKKRIDNVSLKCKKKKFTHTFNFQPMYSTLGTNCRIYSS